MTQPANDLTLIDDAAALLRGLAGPGSYLARGETGEPRWLIHGRARNRAAAADDLVRRLEAQGLLMRLPDGRIVPSLPAARRRLVKTTVAAEDGTRIAVTINAAESPLGWMIHRKGQNGKPMFDSTLIAAAERLRQDYTAAQLEPRTTAVLDGFVASGARGRSGASAVELPARTIAAKQRFFAALDAVGPELANILAEVCCLTSGLEQAERNLSLPVRSGKAVLALALTRLARHYGFLAQERAGERHRAIRRWHCAGLRSSL